MCSSDLPALAWRLSQVGIVEAAAGDRLQSQLVQGQRLVSREGALWRWDGLTMAADAASAAATRLRQRNRLKAVADDIGHSEVRRAGAVDALEPARAAAAGAAEAEAQSRDALRLAEDAHHKARDARAEAAADAAAEASRLLGLNQDATRIAAELKDGEEQRLATQQSLDGLEPDGDGRATLGALRERLTESRGELSQRLNAYERLRREAAARVERLSKIAADMESWKRRAGGADERLAQLAERRATAAAELDVGDAFFHLEQGDVASVSRDTGVDLVVDEPLHPREERIARRIGLVRIVNAEAAAGHAPDEVDRGAAQQMETEAVDEQLEPFLRHDDIVFAALIELEAVFVAGAAALHVDA